MTMIDEDVIRVYTDGACIDNGKPYARAGYGMVWRMIVEMLVNLIMANKLIISLNYWRLSKH